jgi:hypothetical protein
MKLSLSTDTLPAASPRVLLRVATWADPRQWILEEQLKVEEDRLKYCAAAIGLENVVDKMKRMQTILHAKSSEGKSLRRGEEGTSPV